MIERHDHSRVEIMVKAKSQFKRRSTANNVEIMIPVPSDADSPKFKTTIGRCFLRLLYSSSEYYYVKFGLLDQRTLINLGKYQYHYLKYE